MMSYMTNSFLQRMEERGRAEWARARITRDENGQLHSVEDQPAICFAGGTLYWYRHGVRHRDGELPAAVESDGTLRWFKHGRADRGSRPWIRWRPLYEGLGRGLGPDGERLSAQERQLVEDWVFGRLSGPAPWPNGRLRATFESEGRDAPRSVERLASLHASSSRSAEYVVHVEPV